MTEARRPLLGLLAGTQWLSKHGEVLAVQAVGFLLAEPTCEAALRLLVAEETSRELPTAMEWRAESVEDEGRPDLMAGLPGEHARVIVEAKFDHTITLGQLQAYARNLGQHPEPPSTALLLLVPEHRRREAERVGGTVDAGEVALGVISWDQLIKAFHDCASGDAELLEDVRQFDALCKTYGAKDIRPFTREEASSWPARRTDLMVIVDRVTSELSSDRLLPTGVEQDATTDEHGYYRRYISAGGPEVSLGVRQPRRDFQTPIWMRYHYRTSDFAVAKQRLRASGAVVDEAKRGHIYVPVDLPLDVSGAEVVRLVKGQVQRVHSVALGRAWPEFSV